jgi:hypothetical protein
MRVPLKASAGRLRFWLAEHSLILGLLLTLVAVTPVLAPILYMILPRGPPKAEAGVVEAFGLVEAETGTYPRAIVRLAEKQVSVALPRGHNCILGSTIVLHSSRTLLGRRYAARGCKDLFPPAAGLGRETCKALVRLVDRRPAADALLLEKPAAERSTE